MLDVLGWTPLSQRRQEARLILFYKIINGDCECYEEEVQPYRKMDYKPIIYIYIYWHKCPSKVSLLRRIRVLEENTT